MYDIAVNMCRKHREEVIERFRDTTKEYPEPVAAQKPWHGSRNFEGTAEEKPLGLGYYDICAVRAWKSAMWQRERSLPIIAQSRRNPQIISCDIVFLRHTNRNDGTDSFTPKRVRFEFTV